MAAAVVIGGGLACKLALRRVVWKIAYALTRSLLPPHMASMDIATVDIRSIIWLESVALSLILTN